MHSLSENALKCLYRYLADVDHLSRPNLDFSRLARFIRLTPQSAPMASNTRLRPPKQSAWVATSDGEPFSAEDDHDLDSPEERMNSLQKVSSPDGPASDNDVDYGPTRPRKTKLSNGATRLAPFELEMVNIYIYSSVKTFVLEELGSDCSVSRDTLNRTHQWRGRTRQPSSRALASAWQVRVPFARLACGCQCGARRTDMQSNTLLGIILFAYHTENLVIPSRVKSQAGLLSAIGGLCVSYARWSVYLNTPLSWSTM